MYVDEPTSRELLRRLVQNITSNPVLWDDLLQEALIHLWITETRRPGGAKVAEAQALPSIGQLIQRLNQKNR